MKCLAVSIVFFACGFTAIAQTGKLAGSVKDSASKTSLESATISLLDADSSLISYRLSDKNGSFFFDKLPIKRKLKITVSYVGYRIYTDVVQLTGGATDSLLVVLALSDHDSNAVVVTAATPIRMNGDTLEINPAAFKLNGKAVVEELLNQVPGITIWSDGSMTVNGKKVENVLVDGKPFLGMNDPRIATQNLPKSAIDKIQLYQEYDRTKIGNDQVPQDSLLTMNIKLKENSKTGYFGKAGAGYGTTDRFESDLSFQMYNKKSSLGIGGGINNINKNISNFQEMFRNNTFSNFNPNLYNVGRFGAGGINKSHSIGALFTHNFIETTNSRQNNRLTTTYNKTGSGNFLTDVNLQNRTALSNPQFIKDEGVQNTRNSGHDIGINYSKTNSYNDNMAISAGTNINISAGASSRLTEVRDGNGNLQNTNSSKSTAKGKSDAQSASFTYANFDEEEPLKNFNFQVFANRNNYNSHRNVITAFDSYTDNSKDTVYNRNYTTENRSVNLNASADYGGFKRLVAGRHNLFGIGLRFTQSFNYSRSTDKTAVSDFDYSAKNYVANNKISNENIRQVIGYAPTLGLNKTFFKYGEKFSRNISADLRIINDLKTENIRSSIAQRNINRSFSFLRYAASINHWYQQRNRYQVSTNLSYEKRYDYPSVDNLYTITDDINAYDIRIGNPNLRNRTDHSFNFGTNFNTQNPKSLYTFNYDFNGSFTRSIHPVTDSIINELSGKRISYYINADQRNTASLSYGVRAGRKFKKNDLQFIYRGSLNHGRFPNYIDGSYTISETRNLSNQFTLQLAFKTAVVLMINKTLQQYTTKQSALGLRSFSNTNDITKFGLTVNYPKNLAFSTTLDHVNNSNLSKPTLLWNAFISYRCLQQQGELKFTAMDILKQYQNISNSANAYGTTTRITNGLQQYFMFTFSYYPRKFGKREIKSQQTGQSNFSVYER